MKEFFPDLLDIFSGSDFLLAVCGKFHYEKTQVPELRSVADKMLPFMRREAFWERKEPGIQCGGKAGKYEKIVMSLGSGIDTLQENYHKEGLLSESYMLEALASELLLKGYGAYNRYVKENSGWHVAGYHFPGNEKEFPLEMLPELLKDCRGRVTCNTAFCLLPKKSVVFIAELTQDESIQCESICMNCHNSHCPNKVAEESPERHMWARMADLSLNYGYSRIFGKYLF